MVKSGRITGVDGFRNPCGCLLEPQTIWGTNRQVDEEELVVEDPEA